MRIATTHLDTEDFNGTIQASLLDLFQRGYRLVAVRKKGFLEMKKQNARA